LWFTLPVPGWSSAKSVAIPQIPVSGVSYHTWYLREVSSNPCALSSRIVAPKSVSAWSDSTTLATLISHEAVRVHRGMSEPPVSAALAWKIPSTPAAYARMEGRIVAYRSGRLTERA